MASRSPARSVYDYPEHLNPFNEDDNHGRLRFWTLGRKSGRSSSFSLASMKDLKNSWKLGSFRRKDKKSTITACISAQNSPEVYRKNINGNADSSPILARHASMRQTQGDRYVYAGSVTPQPLPRSRFQQRVSHLRDLDDVQKRESISPTLEHRKIESPKTPSLGDSKADRGSYSSLQSNPFEESVDLSKSPVRASMRKKRKAPLPPIAAIPAPLPSIPNITVTDVSLNTISVQDSSSSSKKVHEDNNEEIDIDDPSFKTELIIIENDDKEVLNEPKIDKSTNISNESIVLTQKVDENCEIEITPEKHKEAETELCKVDLNEIKIQEIPEKNDIDATQSKNMFEKVNIDVYKRQQSKTEEEKESAKEEDKISIADSIENLSDDIEVFKKTQPELFIVEQNTELGSKDTVEVEEKNDFADNNNVQIRENNKNYSELSEFNEFDQIIREIENNSEAILNLHESERNIEKRRTVSNMKLLFENANPLPKPRRTKLSNSSISSESKTPSAPSTPIGNG